MASLRQRRNNWYARVSISIDGQQSEKEIPLKTSSKVEALTRFSLVEKQEKYIKQGIHIQFPWANEQGDIKILKYTLNEAINNFLRYKTQMGLAESSIKRLKDSLNILVKLYGSSFPIKSVNRKHIDLFAEYCCDKYSKSGTNINLRNLNTFLKWLFETEKIERVPIIRLVKVEKRKPSYLTEKEFALIMSIDDLDLFYKRIFKFYIGTGCRLSEPFNGSVQGDYLVIPAKYTKAKREKEIFLSNELKQIWKK